MTFNVSAISKDASRIGHLDPDHRIDFTVVLCSKTPLPAIHSAEKHGDAAAQRAPRAAHLNHAELQKTYGAIAGSVELVKAFAKTFGLEIIEMAPQRRSVRIRGRAADVGRAFKTSFEEFELNGQKFFAPIHPPSIPVKWKGVIETVLGLQTLGHAWPQRRSVVHGLPTSTRLHALAKAYAFPPNLDGSGETIGLIEFGGGFYAEDIKQFCAGMGVATPRITVVEVGSGANRPASRREVHEFLDVVSGTLTLAAEVGAERSFRSGPVHHRSNHGPRDPRGAGARSAHRGLLRVER